MKFHYIPKKWMNTFKCWKSESFGMYECKILFFSFFTIEISGNLFETYRLSLRTRVEYHFLRCKSLHFLPFLVASLRKLLVYPVELWKECFFFQRIQKQKINYATGSAEGWKKLEWKIWSSIIPINCIYQ